jgi:hypothetical protein
MTTEDTSVAADVNPYWAEAEARLRNAGVGVGTKHEQPITNYSYPTPPMYPPYYAASPYASVPMPNAYADAAYSWPTQQQYIPPPPPSFPVQRPQRLESNARVPFNYATQQLPPQRQKFRMSFQRPQNGNNNRFTTSNPLSAPAVFDTLGDPNGGFFLRGRHPPELK